MVKTASSNPLRHAVIASSTSILLLIATIIVIVFFNQSNFFVDISLFSMILLYILSLLVVSLYALRVLKILNKQDHKYSKYRTAVKISSMGIIIGFILIVIAIMTPFILSDLTAGPGGPDLAQTGNVAPSNGACGSSGLNTTATSICSIIYWYQIISTVIFVLGLILVVFGGLANSIICIWLYRTIKT
jgi:hypothetical protein